MSLEDFKAEMERCSNCLGCKWMPFDMLKSQRFGENCPSVCYYNFNTYSARGRYQLALALLTKDADFTDTVVKVIHNCMACGSCDISCKVARYNLEPLSHNLELKAAAVEKGKILPQHKPIMDNLTKEKTMIVGKTRATRANWAKGLGLKELPKEKAEVLFFPGCKFSFDETLQKTSQSAVTLLVKARVSLGFMGNADMCCAGRANQMGFREDFNKSADVNIKAFNAAGIKTIVTPCSDCYHTFKRLYATLGMKIEVLHTVEYIDRLIQQGKIKFTRSVPMTVTYHDPCHLGRLGEPYIPWNGKEKKILNQVHTWEPRRPRYNGAYGIYDAPRNVLARIPGIHLVEMERIREGSWCCGAGGGCSDTNPEFSSWTAAERVTEANATGAEALVTACPWCESNFASAQDENGKSIKVLDIIELVQQAI